MYDINMYTRVINVRVCTERAENSRGQTETACAYIAWEGEGGGVKTCKHDNIVDIRRLLQRVRIITYTYD